MHTHIHAWAMENLIDLYKNMKSIVGICLGRKKVAGAQLELYSSKSTTGFDRRMTVFQAMLISVSCHSLTGYSLSAYCVSEPHAES